jgi:hypothetical protein
MACPSTPDRRAPERSVRYSRRVFRRKKETANGRVSADAFTEVLQSLFPTLNSGDDGESGRTASSGELARRLVVTALDQPDIASSSQWSDLVVFVEALLQRRDAVEPPWNQFAQTFIEDLLNAVSHGDLPLAENRLTVPFFLKVGRWLSISTESGCHSPMTKGQPSWMTRSTNHLATLNCDG